MTDRVKGFYVALEKDIKTDDFETIKNAVMALRGVMSVEVSVDDSDDWMNRERVKFELRQELWEVIWGKKK